MPMFFEAVVPVKQVAQMPVACTDEFHIGLKKDFRKDISLKCINAQHERLSSPTDFGHITNGRKKDDASKEILVSIHFEDFIVENELASTNSHFISYALYGLNTRSLYDEEVTEKKDG